ncbi:CCHC-type domain-containing protein [Nephila pilipes]|uniref:CCHC-type domain-containing protein n=1 Tax=Nephila pilipes TaxID=299642 RepID=A0A8X6IXV0_NEPPI|nr:CCHC-type domain-containing protein [Nephila pilipes]
MKNNPNHTFKKKEEFRKPFPIKKSPPVGGSYDNHSPGPSRTVPRFPSSRTEGRKPIQCYGCGTPGVIKSRCPTCKRASETETAVNCMTLSNLNSNSDPSSLIVLRIFGEKIAVCADTGASHTIAGEKLFKFLQERDIIFEKKIISLMMADGIRQTITALSAVVNLYIEGKVIPTEFLVLPEAKGNKTLLERDFLNAAGIVLDVQGGKWYFSENPRSQYEFFKKPLEEIAISAFELREDEVTYEIADPANPDQVLGTYHISALKDYHEPGVERDTGPVAPLRKRGRLKKLPPGSEPRRQRNQRGSKVIPTEFLVLPEAKGNKTLLERDFLNAAGIVLDVQGGKWYFSENPRSQYEFFKKPLEEIAISAFELREDEVTYEIADPANPDQVLGTYHISALKDYHEPGVERDTGPVAPLRKRGRLKKLPPGSEPRRQRNQRGSL